MKKLIFYLCLFFLPTLATSKSYDEAAQEDPKAFQWVQRFAKSGNRIRKFINSAAEQKGDSVRSCVENMSCVNLALLVTTQTHEGKQVQELFEQYPFFKQLFEEQQKRCQCCNKKRSELIKTKQKTAIPAKYNPIVKLCTSTFCVQKQNEQDETILNIIAQKNNRRARLEKNLENITICASPF